MGLMGAGLDTPQAQAALAALLQDSRQSPVPFGALLSGSAIDLVNDRFPAAATGHSCPALG